MALAFPMKDPGAHKDYGVDWSALLAAGETITAATWTVDQPGLTIGATSISGSVCTVWLSGGADGSSYKLTNQITTSRGLVDERIVAIKVKVQ